jgi:ABC-type multidrug transport system fused ATPase/permease subunit
LLPFLLRYRKKVALATVAMFMYSGTVVALPWIIRRAIDREATSRVGSLGDLGVIVSIFLAMAVVQPAAGLVYRRTMVTVAEWVLCDIRAQLFDYLQALSMSFYDRNEVGKVMSRVQNDVQQIEQLFSTVLLTLAGTVGMGGARWRCWS